MKWPQIWYIQLSSETLSNRRRKIYFAGKLWCRQQFEKFGSLWLANTKIDIYRELFEVWSLLIIRIYGHMTNDVIIGPIGMEFGITIFMGIT